MRFFLLACLSLCIFSTGAQAQVSIAVVNIESILGESKAAISIKKQVEKYRRAFLGEVKRAEDKLRTDQQAIEKQRSELTKEELLKAVIEVREVVKDPDATVSRIKIKLLKQSAYVQKAINSLLKRLPVESIYLALTPDAKRMLNDGLDALEFAVLHYRDIM